MSTSVNFPPAAIAAMGAAAVAAAAAALVADMCIERASILAGAAAARGARAQRPLRIVDTLGILMVMIKLLIW
jgi:hypothetical protein